MFNLYVMKKKKKGSVCGHVGEVQPEPAQWERAWSTTPTLQWATPPATIDLKGVWFPSQFTTPRESLVCSYPTGSDNKCSSIN